jgi:hypothetical protein
MMRVSLPLKEIFSMPRAVLSSFHLDLGRVVAAVALLTMLVTGLLVEH